MEQYTLDNNMVELRGDIDDIPVFSHEVFGEGFYLLKLRIPRLSEANDIINITVSERLIKDINLEKDMKLYIQGQFRSYNNFSETGSKLVLTVFAREIFIADRNEGYLNNIYLNGFICKPPVYRTTPFGREIADILIAVNRSYNKSDYIPAIAWGRNAKFAENLAVGENINIYGRIQSREYQKKISENETETKTAYEVSIGKMETGDTKLREQNNETDEQKKEYENEQVVSKIVFSD